MSEKLAYERLSQVTADRRFVSIGTVVEVPYEEVEARFKQFGLLVPDCLRFFHSAYQQVLETPEFPLITVAIMSGEQKK